MQGRSVNETLVLCILPGKADAQLADREARMELVVVLVELHQLFATLSSDEFKKTAAAKKNLCGCRSNWRLEAKKSPVVPGK